MGELISDAGTKNESIGSIVNPPNIQNGNKDDVTDAAAMKGVAEAEGNGEDEAPHEDDANMMENAGVMPQEDAEVRPEKLELLSYLPEDTFSIMAISWPWSADKGDHNHAFATASAAFSFSIMIFGIQATILVLIFIDIFDSEGYRQNVAPPVVRASQLIAIIISVLSAEDVLGAINIFINRFPGRSPWDEKDGMRRMSIDLQISGSQCHALITKPKNETERNDEDMPLYEFTPNFWVWHLANTLRFIEGFACLTVTLFLIMESNSTRDVLLGFAAAQFVSSLDNMAYGLAKWRYFGQPIRRVAQHSIISDGDFRPYPTMNFYLPNWTRPISLAVLLACGIISWAFLCHNQLYSLPKSLVVQFGDDENFRIGFASGKYTRSPRPRSIMARHADLVYTLNDLNLEVDENPFALKYCMKDSTWRLLMSEFDNCNNEKWFVRSSKMEGASFRLPSSEDHGWFARSDVESDAIFPMKYIRILDGEEKDTFRQPKGSKSECRLYRGYVQFEGQSYSNLYTRLDDVESYGRPVYVVQTGGPGERSEQSPLAIELQVYMSVGRRWAYVVRPPQGNAIEPKVQESQDYIPNRLCFINDTSKPDVFMNTTKLKDDWRAKHPDLAALCGWGLHKRYERVFEKYTSEEKDTIKKMVDTLIWQLRNGVSETTIFPPHHNKNETPKEFDCPAKEKFSLEKVGAIPLLFSNTYDIKSNSDSGSPKLLKFFETENSLLLNEKDIYLTKLGPYDSMVLNTRQLWNELVFESWEDF